MARLKGSKNKVKADIAGILRLNSIALLEKAINLALSEPDKYNNTLNKLLDKITPNLNITQNINITKDFEQKLDLVTRRANELIKLKPIEIEQTVNPESVIIPNKEDKRSKKTDVYYTIEK